MAHSGKYLVLVLVLACLQSMQAQKFDPSSTEENVLYEVDCADNTFYIVKQESKLAIIDSNHEPLTEAVYDHFKLLKGEMLYALINSQPSLVNCKGETITAEDYREINVYYNNSLNDRYFVTNRYGKIGLINGNGDVLIPVIYNTLDPMSQHKYLYALMEDQKQFFDYNGNEIQYANLDQHIKRNQDQ